MAPNGHWSAKFSPGTGIEQWLHLVEGSVCWQRYCQQLSLHFDNVREIEERFVIIEENAGGKLVRMLDPGFFLLIGVEDPRHQRLFSEWFAQSKCAAVTGCTSHSRHLPRRHNCPSNGHGFANVHGQSHRSSSSGRTNANSNGHSGRNESGAQSLQSANLNALGESATSSRTPYDWSLLSMGEWLREVDPCGCLLVYLRLLEENYDSVEQVMDVYVQADALGVGALDPQFFEDTRVEDSQHQQLFTRWFAAEFGAQSSSRTTQGSNQGSGADNGDTNGSVGSGEPTTPPRTPPDWRRVSVEEWLRSILEVFPSQYAQRLKERYENADALLRARILPGPGCWSLDPQLFTDAGIESKHHQRLIQDWFTREHGRGALLASVPERETLEALEALAVSGVVRAAKGGLNDQRAVRAVERRLRMSCADWLRLIDGAEAWMRYEEALADKFSDVREIEDRYVSRSTLSGKFKEIDASFFDAIGVTDADHRQRFQDWFATAQVPKRCPEVCSSVQALPCGEWLRLVEGEAMWLRYGTALSAAFDDVDQIERRYVKISDLDGIKRLDPAFFRVAGVNDIAHRRRFENWFKSNSSAAVDLPLERSKSARETEKLASGCATSYVLKQRLPVMLTEPEQEPERSRP